MKKVLFAAMAVMALAGAGCSGSSSGNAYTPVKTTGAKYAPAVSKPGSDPVNETNIDWIQAFYAAQEGLCPDFQSFFAPALRATLTDADCTAAFARLKDTVHPLSIDWDKAAVSADGKTVNLVGFDGKAFGSYVLGADNVWYLNSKFWE